MRGNYSVGMVREQIPDGDAFRAALAAELRSELARRKMPKKELGDAFGWGRNKIGKLINGESNWNINELINACDYLSDNGPPVDVAELLSTAKRKASPQLLSDARTGS
jgi:hypothetical protein